MHRLLDRACPNPFPTTVGQILYSVHSATSFDGMVPLGMRENVQLLRKQPLRLHVAFLSSQVNRTYFVPLDRMYLLNKFAHHSPSVNNVRFGPNEVALLTGGDLSECIPQDGLKRFGNRHIIPMEKLEDRYWLIVKVQENAGAIWERGSFRFMYEPISEYGKIPMFKPTFPMDVEKSAFCSSVKPFYGITQLNSGPIPCSLDLFFHRRPVFRTPRFRPIPQH